MTLRSARAATRIISPPARVALCSVVVSAGLALSLGFASASAPALGAPSSQRAHAAHAQRCRRARPATTRERSRCARAQRARASVLANLSRVVSSIITRAPLMAPTVTITSGPTAGANSSSASVEFAFDSSAAHASFQCALDARRYSSCSSPAAYGGLANGQHTFAVYAVARGLRGPVASVSWNVALTAAAARAPSTPSGLVATPGDTQVTLSWKPSTASSPVAGYRVFRDGGQVGQVSFTSFTDSGLSDGTSYTYTVQAFDSAGALSALSKALSATPLAASSAGGGGAAPTPPASAGNPPAALSAWVAPTNGYYTPLSDAAAAADVTPQPENRPANTAENDYMPTAAQLQAFYSATNNHGQTVVAANPYYQYVTGHYSGTTDEIIQWAAWKWGIPADWLRAEYVQESRWNMSQLGDIATVTPTQYAEYPPQARVPGTDEVYQSMGISQIKWTPDGADGAGTEPLRWESTAFNADYQAATLRFYFDDPDGLRSAWGDASYAPGNAWDSLGGWFEPYPWLNAGQLNYIAQVQAQLAARAWAQPGF